MSKEWWVCTYTTIADTSATTVTARLCTILQYPTIVMPYYFRSNSALAIANNVIITTWSSLSLTWAVGVC